MASRLALLLCCCALAGCELVADFDRGKIAAHDAGRIHVGTGGAPDAGTPSVDAATPLDAAIEDDAGVDAGR